MSTTLQIRHGQRTPDALPPARSGSELGGKLAARRDNSDVHLLVPSVSMYLRRHDAAGFVGSVRSVVKANQIHSATNLLQSCGSPRLLMATSTEDVFFV
jgi:hypothetical protein